MRARLLLLSLCALAASACLGDLERASNVYDLRLLGIRVDPPDLVIPDLDPKAPQIPSIPVFEIEARVGDAFGATRPVQYRITTCPDPDRLRCEGQEGALVLGEGTVENGVARARLFDRLDQLLQFQKLLEDAIAADTYKGFGGLPLLLGVHVWSGEEEVWGAKRLVVWLPMRPDGDVLRQVPGLRPNVNPPPPAVTVDGVIALPGDRPRIKGRRIPLDVFPPDPALREEYVVPLFDGGVRALRENWTYAWFTTKGHFTPETSGGYNPLQRFDLPTEAVLTLGDDDQPGDLEVVVVVRDERGGETWSVRQVTWEGP